MHCRAASSLGEASSVGQHTLTSASIGRGGWVSKRDKAFAQVSRPYRWWTGDNVALAQKRGECGGQRAVAEWRGAQQHMAKPRMQAQFREPSTVIGDAPRAVKPVE